MEGVRVLIADDEKAFSSVLADLVRSCEHEVIGVVHSGLDAIRAYRQHKPDCVLMDFAMAKLNGLTACRNILSDDPSGCILFLSGFGERSELTPESSGALGVLQKPINRALLERVLREAASRRGPCVRAQGTLDAPALTKTEREKAGHAA
jgi:CheY-like chemotaxis protein